MLKLKLALLATLAVASANALACYTVYDRSGRVVYDAQTAPVDMSRPIHETVPRAFPGGHMVFDLNGDCPVHNIDRAAARPTVAAAAATAPLLTDVATAESMGLRHTNLGPAIALVSPRDAARVNLPTFNVIPSDTAFAAARLPTTQAMGAGPASGLTSATQYMGAGPASSSQDRGTIITELRDPPVTIIQRGRDVIVRQR